MVALITDHQKGWIPLAEMRRLLGSPEMAFAGALARCRAQRVGWVTGMQLRAESWAAWLKGWPSSAGALLALTPIELTPVSARMLLGAWLGSGDAAYLHRLCSLTRAPTTTASAALEGGLLLAQVFALAESEFPPQWKPQSPPEYD